MPRTTSLSKEHPLLNTRVVVAAIALLVLVQPLYATTDKNALRSFRPTSTHDIWVDVSDWKEFKVLCFENDTLSGEFEVLNDQTIDFLLLEENSYSRWGLYYDTIGYLHHPGVTSLNWSVRIPTQGYWYVVYSNVEGVDRVHIQGSIVAPRGESVQTVFLIFVVFVVGVVVVCALSLNKIRKWMSIS
ncbi:MAG: hypothetical protein ACFE7R_06260 [Candidatus Hodarchaeota archaeon]